MVNGLLCKNKIERQREKKTGCWRGGVEAEKSRVNEKYIVILELGEVCL